MFGTLIESRSSRQRRTGAALLSFLSHAVILAGAAVLTAGRAIGAPRDPVPTAGITYLKPPRPNPTQPASPIQKPPVAFPCKVCFGGIRIASSATGPTLPTIDAPEPMGFGHAAPQWCTRVTDCAIVHTTVDSGFVSDNGIIVSAEILTQLRSGPPPRYPESLRSAGIDGRVVIQFVVDTLGAIEPASVKVILSSHDLFTRSVETVLPRYRFVPSEVNGRRVRALAQMPFEFHLTK